MPLKRDIPQVPLSDQVTRSKSLSAGQEPEEEGYPDQEPHPVSRASSSDTLIADSSGPSVWSIADSVDVERIRLPHPTSYHHRLRPIFPDPV
jgi:hypothetical protein